MTLAEQTLSFCPPFFDQENQPNKKREEDVKTHTERGMITFS